MSNINTIINGVNEIIIDNLMIDIIAANIKVVNLINQIDHIIKDLILLGDYTIVLNGLNQTRGNAKANDMMKVKKKNKLCCIL